MQKTKNRIVAMLLVSCMILLMLPQFVFAFEGTRVMINESTGAVAIEGYVEYVDGIDEVYIIIPAQGKTYADFAKATTTEELTASVIYMGYTAVSKGGRYETTFAVPGITREDSVYVGYNGIVENANGQNSAGLSRQLRITDKVDYVESVDTVDLAVLAYGYTYQDYKTQGDAVVEYNLKDVAVKADGSFEGIVSDAPDVTVSNVLVIKYNGDETHRKVSAGEVAVIFYVDSANGNDSATGYTPEDALKTIKKAEEKYQRYAELGHSVDVILCGGTYASIPLTVSALGNARITYIGSSDEETSISGMTRLAVSDFNKVRDEEILSRIDPNAADNLYVINLADYGIPVSAFADTAAATYENNTPGIYLNGKPQPLAKWPNGGYAQIKVNEKITGSDGTIYFKAKDQQFTKWMDVSGAYLEGIFNASRPWIRAYGWAEELNSEEGSLTFTNITYGGVGSDELAGKTDCQITINNFLEGIDIPGEWYIDKETMNLYYYMPDGISRTDVIEIASKAKSLVGSATTDVANVGFKNLTFKGTYKVSAPLVSFNKADNVYINNCIFENAGFGLTIESGRNNRIENSNFRHIKGCPIWIKGGANAQTLEPSNNLISGNHIYDCATAGTHGSNNYTVNIRMGKSGKNPDLIGDIVENNVVHDSPYGEAIMYNGMDMEIRYNEFYNLIRYVSDAGVIYAGNRLSAYGNYIHHNYIHDFSNLNNLVNNSASAIYWDDYLSGQKAEYNIIVAGEDGNANTRALLEVGRDNIANHNLAVGTAIGYKFSDRNVKNFNSYTEDENGKKTYNYDAYTSLLNVPEAILGKYPQISETKKSIDEDANGLFKPAGNQSYGNMHVDVYSTLSEETALLDGQKRETLDILANQSENTTTSPDSYGNREGYYETLLGVKLYYNGSKTKSTYDDIFVDHKNHDWRVKSSFISKYSSYLAENLLTDMNFDINLIGLKGDYTIADNADQGFKALYPVSRYVQTDGKVSLSWEDALYADKYVYEVATDAQFENLVASGTTFYTSVDVSGLTQGKQYYWRVRARNISKEMANEWESDTGVATFTVGKPDYQVKDIKFFTAEHEEIVDVEDMASAAYMTYVFVNNKSESVDYDIIVSLYNNTGDKMKQVLAYSKKCTGEAGTHTYQVDLEPPTEYESGDMVYVFAWSDGSLNPIAKKNIIE